MTRADKILILVSCLLWFSGFGIQRWFQKTGSTVEIHVQGKVVGQFDITNDQTIQLEGPIGTTSVQIKDHHVSITHSDCKQQICVRRGKVSKAGDCIVCIPNQVVIKIISKKKTNLDVITG
jgi:hypothetical protein